MTENIGSVLRTPDRSGRTFRRAAGVGLTGALALAGLGLAGGVANAAGTAGSVTPSPRQDTGQQASGVHAAAAADVRFCNGGASKRTQTVGSNTPTTFSGTVSLLPTPLVVPGPATGSDTLLLTWSSETQLRGNTKNAQFDWIEGIITVDGVPVTDVGPSQLALSGSSTYGSNATQACVRIGRGNHRIQLQARVVSNSGQSESGWLDDWMLRADVLD
jgi:hypothetical protein